MRASRSIRGAAEPQFGSDPPGHGSMSVCPNPWARSPRLTVRARNQSSRPRRSTHRSLAGEAVAAGLVAGKVAASARTTSRPARADHAAAADPAGPAPTTSTSVRSGWVTHAFSQVGGRSRNRPQPRAALAIACKRARSARWVSRRIATSTTRMPWGRVPSAAARAASLSARVCAMPWARLSADRSVPVGVPKSRSKAQRGRRAARPEGGENAPPSSFATTIVRSGRSSSGPMSRPLASWRKVRSP